MHAARSSFTVIAASLCLAGQAVAQASVPPATAAPSVTGAVATAQDKLSAVDIKAFATLHLAIVKLVDSLDAQLAEPRNKTTQAQQELRNTLRTRVSDLVTKSGLTSAEFERRRYLVSADGDTRKAFDTQLAVLTGAPLPGQAPPAPTKALIAVPPGGAGVHLGHVVNTGPDTPLEMGLLPLAIAEAKIAAQHATLAARTPGDLATMKLHAGHVLHALDPSIVTVGPGRGYGLKRAANGVAVHVELAARAEGAPANVTMHAPHVAASARATVARTDAVIALAKSIQAATDAGEAAKLVTQMISLSSQLETGSDVNSDGRVSPDATEGGLQQAQEHVTLALRLR